MFSMPRMKKYLMVVYVSCFALSSCLKDIIFSMIIANSLQTMAEIETEKKTFSWHFKGAKTSCSILMRRWKRTRRETYMMITMS